MKKMSFLSLVLYCWAIAQQYFTNTHIRKSLKLVTILLVIANTIGCSKKGADSFIEEPLSNFEKKIDTTNLIYDVSDLFIDSKSNIYVLDNGNKNLVVFDKNLNVINKIGNPGHGPGEFEYNIIAIEKFRDTIYVLDGLGSLHIFSDSDGKFLFKKFIHSNLSSMEINKSNGEFLFGKLLKYDKNKSLNIAAIYDSKLRLKSNISSKIISNQNLRGLISTYANYIDINIVVSFDVHDEIFKFDKNGNIIKKIKIKNLEQNLADKKKWKNRRGFIKLNEELYGIIIDETNKKRISLFVFDKSFTTLDKKIIYKNNKFPGKFLLGEYMYDSIVLYEKSFEFKFYRIPIKKINL